MCVRVCVCVSVVRVCVCVCVCMCAHACACVCTYIYMCLILPSTNLSVTLMFSPWYLSMRVQWTACQPPQATAQPAGTAQGLPTCLSHSHLSTPPPCLPAPALSPTTQVCVVKFVFVIVVAVCLTFRQHSKCISGLRRRFIKWNDIALLSVTCSDRVHLGVTYCCCSDILLSALWEDLSNEMTFRCFQLLALIEYVWGSRTIAVLKY